MDLVSLELQRSVARETQEGPSSSAAALVTKAAATAAAAGKGAARQQQQQPLDQRCAAAVCKLRDCAPTCCWIGHYRR